MGAAADTFGFDADGEEEEKAPAPAFDLFDVDTAGGKTEYAKLAARVSAKLMEREGDLHYMYMVTELAKNLCTSMKVEEISDVVAAMEVVKNAKRTVERGGNKKKKKGPNVKLKAAREDMIA